MKSSRSSNVVPEGGETIHPSVAEVATMALAVPPPAMYGKSEDRVLSVRSSVVIAVVAMLVLLCP
jgi:hypothetical protein